MRTQRRAAPLAVALAVTLATAALPAVAGAAESRARCANYDALRRPYFGDLHVHTAYSLDASTQDTRNTPADAYRFARGAALGIQPYDARGRALRSIQLERPLDFAAVTDHAELFGELETCQNPALPGHGSMVCRIYRGWPRIAFFLMNGRSSLGLRYAFCGQAGELCSAAARTPWAVMQEAAAAAYDETPDCAFTSFVAYEWTASGGMDGSNLHRNVIFRSDAVPELPVSFIEARTPQALWDGLDASCAAQGPDCEYLVIPHNSNLSAARMFPASDAKGSPFSVAYARRRARAEPLVEVMQHKGDSECRPGAGSQDELCDFEKLPYDTMRGLMRESDRKLPTARNFVRPVLGLGLELQQQLGANPYAFGLIASTDTHLGAPGYTSEKRHVGHGGAGPPVVAVPRGFPDRIEFNPGGLAVLWAEENSRDSLFQAMRRRETYGTSGPRMTVRLFGGWGGEGQGEEQALCQAPDFAARGYATGVPMGGVLPPLGASQASPAGGAGQTPQIAVWAMKDPGSLSAEGTDLQRVQVIKLWLQDGKARERVYDVAGDPNNRADVDLATCKPRGKGAKQLCRVWRDPDFDPASPALYYARVLENPSCRWNTYVCNQRAVDCSRPGTVPADMSACCDPSVPKTIQERAWTSPVWYLPEG